MATTGREMSYTKELEEENYILKRDIKNAGMFRIEQLELELASTKKMLDEAKEVIGFYANGEHYYQGGLSHGDFNNWEIKPEADGRNIITPGKRARDFLAKHEKKERV